MRAVSHGETGRTLEKGRAGHRPDRTPACDYAPLLKGFCMLGGLDVGMVLPDGEFGDVTG